MSELIRKDEVEANLEALAAEADYYEDDTYKQGYKDAISDATDAILNLFSVDAVEVVHGHWIDCDGYRECSKCGWLHAHNRLNYCPICGAKMDGEREGER